MAKRKIQKKEDLKKIKEKDNTTKKDEVVLESLPKINLRIRK